MGAWSHESFGNDDAPIDEALDLVLDYDPNEYGAEAPDCSSALAAGVFSRDSQRSARRCGPASLLEPDPLGFWNRRWSRPIERALRCASRLNTSRALGDIGQRERH